MIKKNDNHFVQYTRQKNEPIKNQIKIIKKQGVDLVGGLVQESNRKPSSSISETKELLKIKHKKNSSFQYIAKRKLVFSQSPMASWESNGVKYKLIRNLMAIKEEDFVPTQYESEGKFNGYYLVKKDTDDLERSALAVIYNEDTKGIAIFTGILKIKFIDFEQASVLGEMIQAKTGGAISLHITEEYPHINMAFFKFDNYEQTMNVYDLLNSNSFKTIIERVTIDLLQWHRTIR